MVRATLFLCPLACSKKGLTFFKFHDASFKFRDASLKKSLGL